MKGKMFFAFFAVALMLMSAGVVLFGDQGAAEGNAQQVTSGTPKIDIDARGDISFTNAQDADGKDIAGFTWIANKKTLIMDGVNYKSTAEEAFTVGTGITEEITIVIKNENRISCVNDENWTICISFSSSVTVIGTNCARDKLFLDVLGPTQLFGIYSNESSNVINIKSIYLDVSVSTTDVTKGRPQCVYGNIYVEDSIITCISGPGLSSVGFQSTSVENCVVVSTSGNATRQSWGAMIGIISNSIIKSSSGSAGSEGSSYGLLVRNNIPTITNSIIDVTAGQSGKNRSYGICFSNGFSYPNISIKNTVLTASGNNGAMTMNQATPESFDNCDTSMFHDMPIIQRWDQDAEQFVDFKGKVSYEYKLVKAAPARTVTYDLNDGSKPKVAGTAEQFIGYIIDDAQPTKKGFNFIGWSDGVNIYQPGDTYLIGWEDVTFTAVWEEVYTPVDHSNDYVVPVVAVILLLAFFLIFGLVMRRRDEDDE